MTAMTMTKNEDYVMNSEVQTSTPNTPFFLLRCFVNDCGGFFFLLSSF